MKKETAKDYYYHVWAAVENLVDSGVTSVAELLEALKYVRHGHCTGCTQGDPEDEGHTHQEGTFEHPMMVEKA